MELRIRMRYKTAESSQVAPSLFPHQIFPATMRRQKVDGALPEETQRAEKIERRGRKGEIRLIRMKTAGK